MTASNKGAINLHLFGEEFFRNLVGRLVAECQSHFGGRLVAMYVSGSVHRDEAVAGVSDLDLSIFTTDAFNEADKEWQHETNQRHQRELPGPSWGWLPRATPVSVLFPASTSAHAHASEEESKALRRSQAWTHLLRCDATRVYGPDIAAGLNVVALDCLQARARLRLPWDVVRNAAGLDAGELPHETKTNIREWPLPKEPPLRLRKLARLGVLTGAYLLMAEGEFRSYKGVDVLPPLKDKLPQWRPFLEESEGLYIRLTDATPDEVADYLTRLLAWMDWVRKRIDAEC